MDKRARFGCFSSQLKKGMADKPSRGLILYGGGLARSVCLPHAHLHSFASLASCGFLALSHAPSSGNGDVRVVAEFAELLDAREAFDSADGKLLFEDREQEKFSFPTVAERFMGMKAAVITDTLSLKNFGGNLGLTVISWNELLEEGQSLRELPSVASGLLALLGFEEGKILDASQFDLVFVHVEANGKIDEIKDVELLNNMVGELMCMVHSGVDIGSRLHLSVIMSYGANQEDDHLNYSFSAAEGQNNGKLSSVIPRQSYMMKGGKPRESIWKQCPMLLAQYQNAVTRKDTVETFSFTDFAANCGNLVIPADRFIHELAFKLWKSPKYGA